MRINRATLALVLALAGCAPPLPKPDTAVQVSAYLPGQDVVAAPMSRDWWRVFNSPTLDALEQSGLRANNGILQAQANLNAAQANASAANGAFLPQVQLEPPGAPAASRQSYPTGPNGYPPYTIYSLAGEVSYDPGLFGARHYTFQNGQVLAAYQAAELDAARQSVVGNIAAAAIALAGDEAQITTTERIIAAEQNLLNLLQGEYADGAIPRLSVLQQQSVILGTQATLPPLQTAAQQQRDRLAVLTGVLPADFSAAGLDLAGLALPQNVPVELPSTYLADRPDIRAALAQVVAQHAALGIAVAHMYPDFSLSATGGYVAETASALFNTSSAFWVLAGNLLAPLYDGGELRAHKHAAPAQLAGALAAYHAAVLNAFAQAADALAAVQNGRVALGRAAAASQTAEAAFDLSAAQYRAGAIDYTTVLTAQTNAVQVALSEVRARTALLSAIAALEAAMAN
ncbi:MAG: efflux transporter outer membrane subunit [Proteobacteria bacterium]|nr:efflux transporter outer membrane subunit [Pseudomonadota bacterium]MBU6426249.1 efflux transporter outer membrane subunit [Rhodospirillales bacterium]